MGFTYSYCKCLYISSLGKSFNRCREEDSGWDFLGGKISQLGGPLLFHMLKPADNSKRPPPVLLSTHVLIVSLFPCPVLYPLPSDI